MNKITIAVLGFLWSIFLLWNVPSTLPGWFFPFEIQTLSFGWIGLWTLLGVGLFFILPKVSVERQYLLLFLGAWILPILLSFSGSQSLLGHCIESGHGEFVVTGSRGMSISDVIRNYEHFVLDETQRYAASKPPGQVILYMLLSIFPTQVAGEVPEVFVDLAHWRLSIVLVVVMPLLSACIVFPMYALTKRMKLEKPWLPVLLFLVSAPYSLIVMHMDQALYPMLATCTLLCVRRGWEEESRLWSMMAGFIFGIGCFISFSLLPVIIMVGLVLPFREDIRVALGYALLGCVLFYFLLYLGWNYNPFLRYHNAMEHHSQWKGFAWTWGNWWIATRVNIVEFMLWMGPLMPRLILSRKRKDLMIWMSLFLGLLIFGKAAGEVARLWLFLMPMYWIFVCRVGQRNWLDFLLMMYWTGLMKWQMDF